MFGAIGQGFKSYYDQIPDNTFSTILRSGVLSFTATLLVRPSLGIGKSAIERYTLPLIAATVGALASLIHALMTPVFNQAFENDDQEMYYQELTKAVVVSGITTLLITYATRHKIDLCVNRRFNLCFAMNAIRSVFYLPSQIMAVVDSVASDQMKAEIKKWGISNPPRANSTYIIF